MTGRGSQSAEGHGDRTNLWEEALSQVRPSALPSVALEGEQR